MNFNDVFRGVFGIPRQRFPDTFDENDLEGPSNQEDPFQALFAEPEEMFRHFERHFEEVFRNFGFMDFNMPGSFDAPKTDMLPAPPSENDSLRDKFLKKPDSNPHKSMEKYSEPRYEEPRQAMPRWFDWKNFGRSSSAPMKDQDLDLAISSHGLDAVLKSPPDYTPTPPTSNGYFSSTTVTVKGADGRVEKKYTQRDSSGNEKTTIERQYGDQIHSITTKKDHSGIQEHEENFVNMDEKNLDDFNKNWETPNNYLSSRHLDLDQDPATGGMFRRFFKNYIPPPPK